MQVCEKGEVAKTPQAFHHVCKSLRAARTMRAVRAWYCDPKRSEIKNFGLQELTEVLAEMDRMRAGQDKSNAPALNSEGQAGNTLAAGDSDVAQILPAPPEAAPETRQSTRAPSAHEPPAKGENPKNHGLM